MRYLGNKESILTEISDLLESQGLLKDGFSFLMLFVVLALYQIISNHTMTSS